MKKPNLLVISEYPPRNTRYGFGAGGMASFTKNTLLSLTADFKITVLGNTTVDCEESYLEDGLRVTRCWNRSKLSLYPEVLKQVFTGNYDAVLLEFEFAAYGDFFITAFLPLLILILRLSGKRVVVALHQVVVNLATLSGHLNFKEGSLKNFIFNSFLKLYYLLLVNFASQVVVFEELLRRRLLRYAPASKIRVITHGVDLGLTGGSRSQARKEWGVGDDDFVIISFGYITWYKGTDWAIKNTPRDVKLIIAGGESVTQNTKPHYQKYFRQVQRLAQKHKKNVILTGFVPEHKIADFFAGADVVILPYRTMMSASGPLSTAFSMGKPVIFSKVLAPVLWNEDAREALAACNLRERDLVFSFWGGSLSSRLAVLRSDPAKLKRLAAFSKMMGELRAWDKTSKRYSDVLRGVNSA